MKVLKRWCVATVIMTITATSALSSMAAGGVAVLMNEVETLAQLDAGAVPNDGGWFKTATSENNAITLSTEVTAAKVQEMPEVESRKIWKNPDKSKRGIQMYKQWTGSTINFGDIGKYHLSWKQYAANSESYNGAWGRGSYLALVRGYGTNVLETVRIGFDDAYVETGSDANSEYYPAIYCYSTNTAADNSTAAGNIKKTEPYTKRAETPITKGEFYVCDAYITTAPTGDDIIEFKCYLYGESEENAITVTNKFANGNKCQAVRFFNYGSQYQVDKQGITDLKIEKITDDGNYEALREEMAGFNPDFNVIAMQEELDAAYTAVEGLTWKSNNEGIIAIENDKPVLKGGLGKMCLTATLTKGNVSVEKSFPVEVIKQQEPSKIILSDDLTGLEGTQLSEIGEELVKGWSSGYTEKSGSLAASEVISTMHGNAIAVKSVKPDENTNPVVEFTRKLTSGIDFDIDRTYYMTWNQMMDSYNGEYKSQRLQLVGDTLEIDGIKTENNGTPVAISSMFNTMGVLTESNIGNNKFDRDYYPARLFTKNGTRTKSSLVSDFVAQKGRMYTFAVRIDASETGNDVISIKVYPTGTSALTEWQLVEDRCQISGIADTIGFFAQPLSEDAVILYSDIKIDSISKTDVKAYETVEETIKTRSKAEAINAVESLPVSGAWKAELLKETETQNDFVIGAVTFLQDDVLYFYTNGTDDTVKTEKICNVMTTKLIKGKDVTAKITINNNKDIKEDCVVIAAMYNDADRLVDVDISERTNIPAKAAGEYTMALKGDKTGVKVKLFVLNNLNKIQPLSSVISLDSFELVQ